MERRHLNWKDVESPLYDSLEVITISSRKPRSQPASVSSIDSVDGLSAIRGNYASCMEKEIHEQSESLRQTMKGRIDFEKCEVVLGGVESFMPEILRCRRIILIGAASSYHVALACRQIMEELMEVPVFVELASDFLDREVPVFRDDVCILVSQSGETSSVLSACKYCTEREALVMGITNEENSALCTDTHFGINVNAGVEYGVTSTKTYTSQFAVLVMFALMMAGDKRTKRNRVVEIIKELKVLPEKIQKVLQLDSHLKSIAVDILNKSDSILVLGRGYHQATSLEGSFKFKEIVNVHSEGIHAGELKHGPLALICKEMPLIQIIVRDGIYDKCINAIEQVRARGGNPIVICEEEDDETKKLAHTTICIPKTVDCLSGILAVIPFQLLSMHLAVLHGKSIDNPTNLQKTVIEDY